MRNVFFVFGVLLSASSFVRAGDEPIIWRDYVSLLYTSFTQSDQGGVGKLNSVLGRVRNQISEDLIVSFPWHFKAEIPSLEERVILDNVKKLSLTTHLKLMSDDLALLERSESRDLIIALESLDNQLNLFEVGSEDTVISRLIRACRDFQLINQKSLAFFIENTRNVIAFVLAKVEVIQYFGMINEGEGDVVGDSDLVDIEYSVFRMKNRLAEALWRMQELGGFFRKHNKSQGGSLFSLNLSDESFDNILNDMLSGALKVVPPLKGDAASRSIKVSKKVLRCLDFTIRAFWFGLVVEDGGKPFDPRIGSENILPAQQFLEQVKKRIRVSNKSKLTNLSDFDSEVERIELTLKELSLLEKPKIYKVKKMERPEREEEREPRQQRQGSSSQALARDSLKGVEDGRFTIQGSVPKVQARSQSQGQPRPQQVALKPAVGPQPQSQSSGFWGALSQIGKGLGKKVVGVAAERVNQQVGFDVVPDEITEFDGSLGGFVDAVGSAGEKGLGTAVSVAGAAAGVPVDFGGSQEEGFEDSVSWSERQAPEGSEKKEYVAPDIPEVDFGGGPARSEIGAFLVS